MITIQDWVDKAKGEEWLFCSRNGNVIQFEALKVYAVVKLKTGLCLTGAAGDFYLDECYVNEQDAINSCIDFYKERLTNITGVNNEKPAGNS